MSGKKISLVEGFDDLLGELRGASGELPTEGEMSTASGLKQRLAEAYFSELVQSGSRIYRLFDEVDASIRKIEQNISLAVNEQRAVDDEAVQTLKALLRDLDSVKDDFTGSADSDEVARRRSDRGGRPGDQS